MTATNHALTGTVIGLIVGQPLLAIPLAVGSHFICDALPHFGIVMPNSRKFKTDLFRNYLIGDAAFCFAIVLLLAIAQPQHWLLAAICAFAAASPDFLWFNQYRQTRAGKPWRAGAYSRFAKNIQWFERPIGAVVEIAWMIGAVILLLPFFR